MTDRPEETTQLRERVARLETELSEVRGILGAEPGDETPDATQGPVTRRGLLKLAGAGAAGAAGAMLAASPAAAHDVDDVLLGGANNAGANSTQITSTNTGETLAITNNGAGVSISVQSTSSTGIFAATSAVTGGYSGVTGTTDDPTGAGVSGGGAGAGAGVDGSAAGGIGVRGFGATGVQGTGNGASALGVFGTVSGASAAGVSGTASDQTGTGVVGTNTSGGSGGVAVSGTASGPDGVGVSGSGTTGVLATGGNFGVNASATNGSGIGVQGVANNTNGTGVTGQAEGVGGVAMRAIAETSAARAILAFTNANDSVGFDVDGTGTGTVGVRAKGSLAPIELVPGSTGGSPGTGTHSRGELYVDNVGNLHSCKTGGSPGAWTQLNGQSTGGGLGLVLLGAPFRIYDSRVGQPNPSGAPQGVLAFGAGPRTIDCTAAGIGSAAGILFNFTVANTVGAVGSVLLWALGASEPTAASMTWTGNGTVLSNAVASACDSLQKVQVKCTTGVSTHVILDVIGSFS